MEKIFLGWGCLLPKLWQSCVTMHLQMFFSLKKSIVGYLVLITLTITKKICMVHCFAHSIHRVVLILLCSVDRETDELREYLRKLHSSVEITRKLQEKIENRNLLLPSN
jgi:hypothetical protein